MESFLVFLAMLIILATGLFILGELCYCKFDMFKWFFHDKLCWHKPCESKSFDGASVHSVCEICGKDIMQDSQGNWF